MLSGRSEDLQYAQGYAVSVLVHALAVSAAALLAAEVRLVPQRDLFRWNVAMVEAPSQQQSDDNPTHPPTQAEPTSAPPKPATPRHIQTKPVETQPIVHTVQPMPRVVRQEPVHTRRLIQTPTHATYQPIVETAQTINRTTQAIKTSEVPSVELLAPSTAAPVTEVTPIAKDIAVLSTPHDVTAVTKPTLMETTPLSSSESAGVPRSTVEVMQQVPTVQERVVNETATAITESTTVVERARVEAPAAEPSSMRELPVRSTPSVHRSPNKIESFIEQAKIPGPPVVEFSPTKELRSQSRPAAKADFGWLARALLSRIEQLKRYPQTARMNHWEGRVVLRAVIREDGELIGVDVAESSGHSVLDDDALDIIRKASPLMLAHPLGQSQVVVRVPLRYRLEQ